MKGTAVIYLGEFEGKHLWESPSLPFFIADTGVKGVIHRLEEGSNVFLSPEEAATMREYYFSVFEPGKINSLEIPSRF